MEPQEEPKPTPAEPAAEPEPPAEPEAPVSEVPAATELVIAPGVARMGTPVGAGRPIPANGAPGYLFLAFVSVATLGLDIASKIWAEKTLELRPPMTLWEGKTVAADFLLAKNKGGAWGLLQGTPESIRRPFFLLVSALAIGFIVTLFSRLQPRQRALRWGLPLVLGGALGNVFDRIRYGFVIDFIDVHVMYEGKDHHWPTFNVADIAICVGVGLMAIDMFVSKRGKPGPKAKAPAVHEEPPPAPVDEAKAEAPAPDQPTDEASDAKEPVETEDAGNSAS